MASRKSAQQWQEIFDAHKISGLTVAKFCQQNSITKSAFYAHQHRFKKASLFIKAQVIEQPALTQQVNEPVGIRLFCSAGELRLSALTPVNYLIKLINGLSV